MNRNNGQQPASRRPRRSRPKTILRCQPSAHASPISPRLRSADLGVRFLAKHVKAGTSIDDFRTAVIEKLADRPQADGQLSGITVASHS
jgi:hypothetical protein